MATAFIGGPHEAQAQCLPENATLKGLWGFAVKLATDPNEPWVETRTVHDIPESDSSEVFRIFDDDICQSAAQVYQQHFGLPATPDLYMIRISYRYLVLDPNTTAGEFQAYLVLDLKFNVISSWIG